MRSKRWLLLPVRRRPPRLPTLLDRYWLATHRPLYCLIFLLPMAAVYEIGLLFLAGPDAPRHTLVANNLIQGLLGWFGASGFWLPGLALVVTLLAWHVTSGGSWRVRAWVPAAMLGESLLAVVPLLVLRGLVLTAEAAPSTGTQLIVGLGAAVYEELVFRLYLIVLLTVLIAGVCRVPLRFATPIIIVVDGLIFSLCHFQPVGVEPFGAGVFLLRWVAGAYLALLFVTRGLGVAAGCHAAHNALGVLW